MPAAVQPSAGDWQERTGSTLGRLVEDFTGPVAKPCGIAWLPPVPERAAFFPTMEKEIAAALACVLEARGRGQATWAFWQFQGIDSTVFGGVATAPAGELHTLHYDDYGGRPDLHLRPCVNPRLESQPGPRIMCDNGIEALSAPQLAQAFARLEDDIVVTTVGADRRGLAARIARETEARNSPLDPGFLTTVVDAVQLAIQEATGSNWPVCPRHDGHPLEFRDHRWFCVRDGAFLAELGGLAALGIRP